MLHNHLFDHIPVGFRSHDFVDSLNMVIAVIGIGRCLGIILKQEAFSINTAKGVISRFSHRAFPGSQKTQAEIGNASHSHVIGIIVKYPGIFLIICIDQFPVVIIYKPSQGAFGPMHIVVSKMFFRQIDIPVIHIAVMR